MEEERARASQCVWETCPLGGESQNLALSQPETAPVPSVAVGTALLAPLSQGFFCEEGRKKHR